MCDICEKAKKFKDTFRALEFISKKTKGSIPECVDSFIGELLGENLPAPDKKADGDWERATKGRTDSRSERME